MKFILHISLLLLVPFLAIAEDRPHSLDGIWIDSWHDTKIKVRENHRTIEIKGLQGRRWTTFRADRRGRYKDRNGNTIEINNVHDLEYRSVSGRERIRFIKKGHSPNHHSCNRACVYSDGVDHYSSSWSYGNSRNENRRDNRRIEYRGNTRNSISDRDDSYRSGYDDEGSERYFVREIDEYIDIRRSSNEVRAKRQGGEWITYRQNPLRKNQYLDNNGNSYIEGYEGDLTWLSENEKVRLNLTRR